MNMTLSLAPLVSLLAGILILVMLSNCSPLRRCSEIRGSSRGTPASCLLRRPKAADEDVDDVVAVCRFQTGLTQYADKFRFRQHLVV